MRKKRAPVLCKPITGRRFQLWGLCALLLLLWKMNRRQAENIRVIMEVQQAERSQIANQLHDGGEGYGSGSKRA